MTLLVKLTVRMSCKFDNMFRATEASSRNTRLPLDSVVINAIMANVELETDPTRDMKRPSLDIATVKARVNITRLNLEAYSAFR